jgi:hypothetical protein
VVVHAVVGRWASSANCNGVSCCNITKILPDSEDEDEQIPEINELLSWQMPDDPDDDDP